MKKLIRNKTALLLVLMLVAAMSLGCGKKAESTETTQAAVTTAQTETTEEAKTEAAPAETTQTEAETTVSETEAETTASQAETETEAVPASDETHEYEKVGEGSTVFYFEATDADKNTTYFEVSTDETTVGAALLALGIIAGEDSSYGLYVKTVNGITADYDKDGTYWAFYIDGEYASTGVDSTDITAGSTYAFVVE